MKKKKKKKERIRDPIAEDHRTKEGKKNKGARNKEDQGKTRSLVQAKKSRHSTCSMGEWKQSIEMGYGYD
jgi:hypothetical protein